jgi:uncharacterized membrane protein
MKKKILIIVLLIIIVLFFITPVFLYFSIFHNGLSSRSEDWGNYGSLLSGTIASFLSFISIILLFYTIREENKNRKELKKQWLNESFIKHEADILLDFQKKLGEANGAIQFFLHDLLTIEKKYAFIKDEPPVIKYSDIQYNFNQLVDLNDFYNSYQNIFRKHHLEHHIECIGLILESVNFIPERDLHYDLIFESDKSQTYRLEEQIISMFFLSFNIGAHLLHDVDGSRPETIAEKEAYNQKNKFKELSRLIGLTGEKLTSLTFKLDKLTTYIDSESATALNCKAMSFFQKK